MNLLEAWAYLQENRDATLYAKFTEASGYNEETITFVETLRIFRDHPYTAYHSGSYPSYFDQDNKGMGCLYDRHITGTYYTTPEYKERGRVQPKLDVIHIDDTLETMYMPNTIRLGKPFILERGGRRAIYKIIKTPFAENAYSLVYDHASIHQSNMMRDEDNIILTLRTMEDIYKQAINYT